MRCVHCHRRLPVGRRCLLHPDLSPIGDLFWAAAEPPDIDGWSLAGHLGSGGFGEVFRATRRGGDEIVAIKIARRPGDPRIERERDALDAVGEPTAPRVIDDGVLSDGRPWLALEYLQGSTLGAWMAELPESGACPPERAVSLLARIAPAIDRVHARGVVHRDLKPDNVFLCGPVRTDGSATRGLPAEQRIERTVLFDFGVASMRSGRSEALTVMGQRLGTVLYAAPEQIADAHTAGPAADRYAFAVIAYELLTGRPPFVGTAGEVEQGHTALRVPRASRLAALPRELDEVLARGLAKEPGRRFDSAAEFVDALARVLAGGAGSLGREGADGADGRAAPADAGRARAALDQSLRIAVLGTYTGLSEAGPGDVTAVAAAAADAHGRIVRVSGRRVLVAFDRADSPAAGVREALLAARAIPGSSRIAIHVIEATLRRGARGVRVSARALDSPDWLPSLDAWGDDGAPILLTERAGLEMAGHGGPAGIPGYVIPPSEGVPALDLEITSNGRVRELAAITRDAHECLDVHQPGLVVITGETGLGKSHLLQKVGEGLAGRAQVIRLSGADRETPLMTALASAAIGMSVQTAPVEAARAACIRVAGDDLGARGWGLLSARRDGGPSGPMTQEPAVPGAARYTLAEFVATGLRRAASEAPTVLLLDDAERADEVSLDALELATLGEEPCALWVCLAGSPALLERRSELGQRGQRGGRYALTPLDPDSARSLLLDLLYPVERVPEAALGAIEQMAEGVPLYLIEIVHALRAGGAIRRRSDSGAWYLASNDLLHVSATPLAERLAARELEALPEVLRSFALTAAVLGGDFGADEVDALRNRLDPEDTLDYGNLDTSVALLRLYCQGLLREYGPGRYGFRHAMLRRGIEGRADAETRRRVHDAAYRWLCDVPIATAGQYARLARHAVVGGHRRAGAEAWLEAAELRAQVHEYVRAEHHFSAALDHVGDEDDELALRGLIGRARMHYRLERWNEALGDLKRARRIAQAFGDAHAVIDCWLDKATIFDWTYRWAESADCVERATPLMAEVDDAGLEARYLLARGRAAFRQADYESALDLLGRAAPMAEQVGDYQTGVVALLLLPVALTFAGRAREAEAGFDDVIALCERSGDVHHLATALNNRLILWEALDRPERAIEDARRTGDLARRIGHTTLESTAAHNLAELLYYRGELDEALALATHARDLYHRYAARPGPEHELLVARIRAARGEDTVVNQILCALRACAEDTWSESARLLFDALMLAETDRDRWRALVARARVIGRGFPNEHLDVLYRAIRAAAADGRRDDVAAWLDEARAIRAASREPWRGLLAAFAPQASA